MKTKNKISAFLISAIFISGLISGCSLSDEDFSDIQMIEQIIKKDQEQIFGVELVNDEQALPEDSLDVLMKTGFSFSRSDFYAELRKNPSPGVLFGRVVQSVTRSIFVERMNDTLASARVSYKLSGQLRIIRPQWSQSKPFEHEMTRYMTFVKIKNPVTNEPWHRVSVTAAYGNSFNSGLILDSIRILTTEDSILADDPYDITLRRGNPLTVRRGQYIWLDIKIRSAISPNDTLAAFVINGQNRHAGEFRERKLLYCFRPNHYGRLIRIMPDQRLEFNQLMIDVYDRNTLRKIQEPYRSLTVAIPYRVIP